MRGRPLAYVELAAADPEPGAAIVFSGYPRGQTLAVAPGRVESYGDGPVMRFTPPPDVGQSGGALLDEDGRLVGMVTGVERAAGIGYAVPVSVLRDVLARIAPELETAGARAAPAVRPRRPACP